MICHYNIDGGSWSVSLSWFAIILCYLLKTVLCVSEFGATAFALV